jgi:hypothetical protein
MTKKQRIDLATALLTQAARLETEINNIRRVAFELLGGDNPNHSNELLQAVVKCKESALKHLKPLTQGEQIDKMIEEQIEGE